MSGHRSSGPRASRRLVLGRPMDCREAWHLLRRHAVLLASAVMTFFELWKHSPICCAGDRE
eukprot:scaffold112020_cov24-Phaeocystis_antarctica.AAC.1